MESSIIILTAPDTPLDNAYQVGSFDFWGEIMSIKRRKLVFVYRYDIIIIL